MNDNNDNQVPSEIRVTHYTSNGFIYIQEAIENEWQAHNSGQPDTHSTIEVYQGILRLMSVLVEFETYKFYDQSKTYGLSYFDRIENCFINLRYSACLRNDGSGYDQNICWIFLAHHYTPFTFTNEMKQRTWEDLAEIMLSRCKPNEVNYLCKKLGKFMNPARDDFKGMFYGAKVFTNGQWGVDVPLVIHNTDEEVTSIEGEFWEETLPFSERYDNTSDSIPLIYRYDVRRLHPSYGLHTLGILVYSDPQYGCNQHRYLPFASLQPSEPKIINNNPNLSKITWNQDQLQNESFKQLLIRELRHTTGWRLTVNTSIPKLIYTTFDDSDKLDKPKRRWSI